jgi:pyrimidine operon attenuation protein/uracil phosphoribosyltransferase
MAAPTRTQLLDTADIRRALVRISHEIVERAKGSQDLYLVGIRTRGVPMAHRLSEIIEEIEGPKVPVGTVDVRAHRDDVRQRGAPPETETHLPVPVDGQKVVLVDEVIFTGRTVRAALDIIMDHGRPESVWLAILIDRGHRELPIRPDFVGRNVPTSRKETIRVELQEVDGRDRVVLHRGDES